MTDWITEEQLNRARIPMSPNRPDNYCNTCKGPCRS